MPVRDIRSIAQAINQAAMYNKDVESLTAAVRIALSRIIVDEIMHPVE